MTIQEERNLILSRLYESDYISRKLKEVFRRYKVHFELQDDIKQQTFLLLLKESPSLIVDSHHDGSLTGIFMNRLILRCLTRNNKNHEKQSSFLPSFMHLSSLNNKNEELDTCEPREEIECVDGVMVFPSIVLAGDLDADQESISETINSYAEKLNTEDRKIFDRYIFDTRLVTKKEAQQLINSLRKI
jgi:hypothetical protein